MAHRSHPIRGNFCIKGELREPEVLGCGLDTTARLAMELESFIQGRARFNYLRQGLVVRMDEVDRGSRKVCGRAALISFHDRKPSAIR